MNEDPKFLVGQFVWNLLGTSIVPVGTRLKVVAKPHIGRGGVYCVVNEDEPCSAYYRNESSLSGVPLLERPKEEDTEFLTSTFHELPKEDTEEPKQSPDVPTMEDHVQKPSHYTQWPIEPVTFISRNGLDFMKGNIVKYTMRAGSKLYPGMDKTESAITDLEKARRYAEMEINRLKGEAEL